MDRLMKFVHRNLPEKFYLPPSGSTQRIDIRSYIFREIAANTLVHREYSHSFPAKFLIFSDRVITENWTKPSGKSHASLDELETHTKNPMITKIFEEIGHVEELGSGRKNIQKYAPIYYKDYKVEVDNEEKFVFMITYRDDEDAVNQDETRQAARQVTRQVENDFIEFIEKIVQVMSGEMKRLEIQDTLGLKDRENFANNYLNPALQYGYIELKYPDSPNHPQQRYVLTQKGKSLKKAK